MKKIVIIGQGGHSKVIQDNIIAGKEFQVYAMLDDKLFKEPLNENGLIFGPIRYAKQLIHQDANFYFIIAIGNNSVRKKIAEQLYQVGAQFATLIHPTAVISPSASIGVGTVVMAQSVINADSILGDHAIINTSAVVEHDNQIGNFAHISPGAVLTGNVKVGEGTQVGAGATVIPGKRIGKWSMVGAGSTVIHHIPNHVTAVGVPAKVNKK